MKNLTKRQAEILSYIRTFYRSHGYSPSFRELMQNFQLASLGSVFKHIESLISKGYLKKSKKAARSIEPLYPEEDSRGIVKNVPIIGSISKGCKIEMFAKITSFELPSFFVKSELPYYGFLVKDDSFFNDAILQSDLIIIEARIQAKQGEMVLTSSLKEGALLERYQDGAKAQLKTHIHGAVVAVFRSYDSSSSDSGSKSSST